MQPRYLILLIAGVICLTMSLIDLLSSKVVRANDGVSGILISTLLYLLLGVAGIALIITSIILHRKNKGQRKDVEDFY